MQRARTVWHHFRRVELKVCTDVPVIVCIKTAGPQLSHNSFHSSMQLPYRRNEPQASSCRVCACWTVTYFVYSHTPITGVSHTPSKEHAMLDVQYKGHGLLLELEIQLANPAPQLPTWPAPFVMR